MILAATDHRLLVFRMFILRRRLAVRGEVLFEALQAVKVERRGLSLPLPFALTSGAAITLTTHRLDHPDEFVRVLNDARAGQIPLMADVPPAPEMPLVVPPPPL